MLCLMLPAEHVLSKRQLRVDVWFDINLDLILKSFWSYDNEHSGINQMLFLENSVEDVDILYT